MNNLNLNLSSDYKQMLVDHHPTLSPPSFASTSTSYAPHDKDPDRQGCYPCRWRKKKCKHVGRTTLGPCKDCSRFNIFCYGSGFERPGGKRLANEMRAAMKAWIADKKNRKTSKPSFDARMFTVDTTHEHPVYHPTPDFVQALFPTSSPGNYEFDNASPQPALHPASYNGFTGHSVIAEPQTPSPAWMDANRFSPHISLQSFESQEIYGSYTSESSGSFHTLPSDFLLSSQPLASTANAMPYPSEWGA